MADVRPLPGIRYDERKAGDWSRLMSPPYDVIPEEDLESYRARSPFNVISLIRPGHDYESARRLFHQWLEDRVLRRDPPAMYLHEVAFDRPNEAVTNGSSRQARRRDLIARLRLQPYSDGVVLPHERTHRGPKADRLELYRATGVSLEPLWFLYEGRETLLPQLLEQRFADEPTATFEFPPGEQHRFWLVNDGGWPDQIARAFAPLQLLIADGHHRYETALAYAEERGGPADAPSRFTLALFTDLADPGLTVLPTHRVLKAGVQVVGGEPAASLQETIDALHGRTAAGAYREGAFQVLPLEGDVAVKELHEQVIDNLLGKRSPEEFLLYTRDAAEAVRWVDEGRGVAAFFLDPPELSAIFAQAQRGVTMPQKSTYFFPKPPSDIVFYRLDAEGTL